MTLLSKKEERLESQDTGKVSKFGPAVVRYRFVIIIIALLLLIPSVFGYVNTKINFDMLTYLPSDMETVKGQDLLLDDFGKGGFSMIVMEDMKSDDVNKIANDVENVAHVDTVLNLEKVLNPNIPTSMYPQVIQDNLKKKNCTMLVVFFDSTTSAEPTMNALVKIRKICSKDCYVAGMTGMVEDLKNLCEVEEPKYVGIAVLLSLIVMMVLLDSYFAPILFLLSIGLAIIYNLGSNLFLGEVAYITKAIAAVLQLAVTMDYSIFLWHSYEEWRDKGVEYKEAMGRAINATLVSVSGSSLTTFAGFLAMCFMSYTMGTNLGIVMAKGVVFGVISSVTILPCLLLFFHKILDKARHRSVIPRMDKVAHALTSRYKLFIAIFILCLVPAIIGYQHQNITYDFSKMMASNAEVLPAKYTQYMTANEHLKEDFGISTTYMVLADDEISTADGSEMTKKLEDVPGITSVLGKNTFSSVIPTAAMPSELTDSLEVGGHQLIMINSSYKVSTDECNDQIDEVAAIVHQYDKNATVIGEAPATKDLIQLTSKDFTRVSLISIGMVFLIILLVLKSWTLPIILVASIEFAIYMNMGISGFTGLEMPFLVPVLISTIQLGSTVDYAILMSTRYKQERMAGIEKRRAVEIAAENSIPSIIVSALCFFMATFGVGVYSDIAIISTLCNLMARGAIISMFTVILILPSLLMAFDKVICRTTIGLRIGRNKKTSAELTE